MAARAIALKLFTLPSAQVQGNTNELGMQIHQTVVVELQRVAKLKKHVGLEFRSSLIEDCNLHGGYATCLLEVEEEQVVTKQLNECLMMCHDSNPAR